MIDKIIRDAFEKAERECASKAKNALAKHISEEIEKRFGFIINERTLVRAYDKYVLSNGESDNPPNQETVQIFCRYLGYENYKDYVDAQTKSSIGEQQEVEDFRKVNGLGNKSASKWFLSVSLAVIIGILGLLLFKVSGIGDNVDSIANKCLYWEVDRYRPIDCDAVLPQVIAKTKVAFSEALYTGFRKFSDVETADYSSVMWKGPSPTGEMDYFTMDGVHPLTKKKLIRVEPETIKNEIRNESAESPLNSVSTKKVTKTIGVLIFENQELDRDVIPLLEKKYFKTFGSKGGLLNSRTITESTKSQLIAGNFSSLKENHIQALDYICIGNSNYSFKKGSISSETVSCRLSLNYEVYSTKTGIKQNNLSQSITLNGIGFTEEEAKANALKKIGEN